MKLRSLNVTNHATYFIKNVTSNESNKQLRIRGLVRWWSALDICNAQMFITTENGLLKTG